MINIFISNDIQIRGINDTLKKHIKKTLTLDNPLYYRLVSMAQRDPSKQRALYACPRTFEYYHENGDTLHIPRGMRVRLLAVLDKLGWEYHIKTDTVKKPMRVAWQRNVVPRPWQKEALSAMREKSEGVVMVGTGGGKTIGLLERVHDLGLTTTILTPNTALLKQWESELKKFYGVSCGLIYAKEKNIQDITVATFQSLYKPTKLAMDLVNNTSVLLVDECHGAITKQKSKVVGRFKPSYLYGTTATMHREDEQDKAISFYFGDTIYKHDVTQAEPVIEAINSRTTIPVDEYPEMIEYMTKNESRNTLITGLTTGEVVSGRKVLVLTKRVAHAEALYLPFKNDNGSYLIDASNKRRNALLDEFKQGTRDFSVIFGTTSLLSVGVDIPALDTLILACDMKAETLLVQSAGRILRLFKGKSSPKIIDIYEGSDHNPILYRQFKKRLSVYKRKGWEVIF